MPELTVLFVSQRENFKKELNKAVSSGTSFDAIVIELDDGAHLSLADQSLVLSQAARILGSRGTLLLISNECALTFGKDEVSTGFITRAFDSPSAVLIRFPLLGSFLAERLPNIRRLHPELVVSLFEHIFLTSTPMRTDLDKHEDWTGRHDEHLVYDTIDGISNVECLSTALCAKHGMTAIATMAALESLERRGLIYPLLPRAEFLSSCYKARRPFKLGHYMVAAGILSQGQLQVCLEKQAEEVETSGQKPLLGQLVVKAGLISEPLLKSLLDDQYFFGGSQVLASAGILGDDGEAIRTFHGAMMGTLSSIDTSSLLQSVAAARKDGLLVIENGNKSAQVKFEDGEPASAMLGELAGDEALMELLVSWSEGTFVFRRQDAGKRLPGLCDVASPLQKLILDASLAQDLLVKIYLQLPGNRTTILYLADNFAQQWQKLDRTLCRLPDGSTLSPMQWSTLEELMQRINGVATIEQIVDGFNKWPSYLSMISIYFLLQKGLLVQQPSLVST